MDEFAEVGRELQLRYEEAGPIGKAAMISNEFYLRLTNAFPVVGAPVIAGLLSLFIAFPVGALVEGTWNHLLDPVTGAAFLVAAVNFWKLITRYSGSLDFLKRHGIQPSVAPNLLTTILLTLAALIVTALLN